MKMEIASFLSFSEIASYYKNSEKMRMTYFFTPREEIQGGSMFAKFSSNYDIISKYLDMVDETTVKKINSNMRNISALAHPSSYFIGTLHVTDDSIDQVHMYQADINNLNPIDYAFQKNAINCIQACMQTLLELPNEK